MKKTLVLTVAAMFMASASSSDTVDLAMQHIENLREATDFQEILYTLRNILCAENC